MIEQDAISMYSKWLTLSSMTTEEICRNDIIAAVREHKLRIRLKNLNLAMDQVNAKFKFKRIKESEYIKLEREISRAKDRLSVELFPIVVRS